MKKLIFVFILALLSIISFSQINTEQINPDSSNLYLGPDFNLCVGYIHLLDAGPGFDSYLWQDGSTDQTYLVTETGTYWVHAYIGTTLYSDTINIGYWPDPDPNLGNDTTACIGSSFYLEPPPGFVSYLWMDGSTLPYFLVSEGAFYSVTVTDIHGCVGIDTILVEYTTNFVDLGSDSVICECGSSLLLDAGEEFISYVWQDGSTSQYFLVDLEIFGVGTHTFSVTALDSYNCENTDSILVLISEHNTNVAQTKYETLQIYPHPANNFLTIELPEFPNERFSIEILNSFGKVIFKEDRNKTQNQYIFSLDISNLNSGIYFLKIRGTENDHIRKLLIQN